MKNEIRHTARVATATTMLLIVLTTMLCWACSSDDATGSPDGTRPMLTIAVSEQAWSGETVSITRAGETLDALKASTAGFGLYCTALDFTNVKTTWSDERWSYGTKVLWPNNSVDQDMAFTAYAPYQSSFSGSVGITACNGTTLTFQPALRNAIDLMWAEKTITADGTVTLNFKHALGKLSLGSVINNYGREVTLKRIDIDGTRYTKRNLNLATGTWSAEGATTEDIGEGDNLDVEGGRIIMKAEGTGVPIPVGESIDINLFTILQIPGQSVTVTYTIQTSDHGEETIVTPAIAFEAGKDKTVNLTIGMNHEVVIK